MCVAQNKMRDGESARESCETANSCFDDSGSRGGLLGRHGHSNADSRADATAFPNAEPFTVAFTYSDSERPLPEL